MIFRLKILFKSPLQGLDSKSGGMYSSEQYSIWSGRLRGNLWRKKQSGGLLHGQEYQEIILSDHRPIPAHQPRPVLFSHRGLCPLIRCSFSASVCMSVSFLAECLSRSSHFLFLPYHQLQLPCSCLRRHIYTPPISTHGNHQPGGESPTFPCVGLHQS